MSVSSQPHPAPGATGATEPPARFPVRLAVAIVAGTLLWMAPFVAGISVLLPALLEQVAPDRKIAAVATLSMLGSVVALIANVLFGALSDRTRSRLGRRTPWMILGSVATAASLFALSRATSVTAIVALWCFFQFFLNAIVAPLVAVIPDRVPERMRGTFSAVYGVGSTVGAGIAGTVASRFVTVPTTGFVVMAVVILLSGPAVALLAPDRSTRDEPPAPADLGALLRGFALPVHGARDFYLALVGKLLYVLAMYTVTGYELYVLTDYLGLDAGGAATMIATIATIQMVGCILAGAVAGPLSDRFDRRRVPAVWSAVLLAVALAVPFVWQDPTAMVVFAVLGLGLSFGVFNAVDQALNYRVLPDAGTAAKDLGILNMANTGGQILGPVVMSLAVTTLGGYRAGFALAAVIALVAAGTISAVRSTR